MGVRAVSSVMGIFGSIFNASSFLVCLGSKVSLFVRAIDLATGETEDVIINKYDAVCDEE